MIPAARQAIITQPGAVDGARAGGAHWYRLPGCCPLQAMAVATAWSAVLTAGTVPAVLAQPATERPDADTT